MMQRIAIVQVVCPLAGISPVNCLPLNGLVIGIGLPVGRISIMTRKAGELNAIVRAATSTSFINKLPAA